MKTQGDLRSPREPLAAARSFDVVCAGDVQVATREDASRSLPLRFRAGGGTVGVAMAVAREGLRVAVATTLDDDRIGRAVISELEGAGVDVTGVALAAARGNLFFVEASGGANEVVPYRAPRDPFVVPESWKARVLLLSGLSPSIPHGAAQCKTARAGRRSGSIVVADVNARWHIWAGRDPRAIQSILREVDVVRASPRDLAMVNMSAASVCEAMRPNAILVVGDENGAWAVGPFGEVARSAPSAHVSARPGTGDAFTAVLCSELARLGEPGESRVAFWERVLVRGLEAACARRAES